MSNKSLKQNKTHLRFNAFGILLLLAVGSWLCSSAPLVYAGAESSPVNILGPAKYVGEMLVYKLSFLLFSEAAVCSTSLVKSKDHNVFIGTFIGETKGFVGWVTSYRKYTYVARMRLVNNGTEFRTISFRTEKKIGSKVVVIESKFDYKKGVITSIFKENGRRNVSSYPIANGVKFDDIISGFYNIRSKGSDEIKEGSHFGLKSFTNNKISVFNIHIQNREEKRKNTLLSNKYKMDNFIFKIKIAKEIFGSKEGLLCVAINKGHLPVKLIIEDVLLFGDVEGELSSSKRSQR